MVRNVSKSILKVNRRLALYCFKDIQNRFQSAYRNMYGLDIPVLLDDELPLGIGVSSDYLFEDHFVKIGVNGLCDSYISFPLSSVSDAKFVKVLVSMFHENHHMDNCLCGYQDCRSDKNENLALAMCYLADHDNHFYYKGNHNYYKNLREIDAECAGIVDACDYLCEKFPDKTKECEQLLVQYVNNKVELVRQGKIDYFFDASCKEFQSLDDVTQAFDDCFVNAMNKFRVYPFNRNCDDLAMSKFCQDREWRKLHSQMLDAEIGVERDKMIGAIVLAVHPEYQDKIYDLKGVDFSPNAVFGQPFPYDEEIAKVRERVGKNRCLPDVSEMPDCDTFDFTNI